jgi:hypothetical protein
MHLLYLDFAKASPIEIIDAEKHIYRAVGSAQIIDDDRDLLSVDDIMAQAEILKARGGGHVVITDGHTDKIIGLGYGDNQIERVLVKDEVTKADIPGIAITYQIPEWGPTSLEIIEDHKEKRVNGLSIKGTVMDATLKCSDNQCNDMHRIIKKAEYFSFALCRRGVRPRNRLARPIEAELLQKAIDHLDSCGLDGKCNICNESVEYYRSTGLTDEEAQMLTVAMLNSRRKERMPDMNKADNSALVKENELLKLELAKLKELNKADPVETPPPAPATPPATPPPAPAPVTPPAPATPPAPTPVAPTPASAPISVAAPTVPTVVVQSTTAPVANGVQDTSRGALQGAPQGKPITLANILNAPGPKFKGVP